MSQLTVYQITRVALLPLLAEHLTEWLRRYDLERVEVEREAENCGQPTAAYAANCIATHFMDELDRFQQLITAPGPYFDGGDEAKRKKKEMRRLIKRLQRELPRMLPPDGTTDQK